MRSVLQKLRYVGWGCVCCGRRILGGNLGWDGCLLGLLWELL
jgi:hypothetical protein